MSCKDYLLLLGFAAVLVATSFSVQAEQSDYSIFDQKNLVAWCIVPFDHQQRGPAERAEMLQRLGIRKVAYDWREQHVASFEEEIIQYKKHDLEYFAFWSWHPSIEPLIQKHHIHPQIWSTNPSPQGSTEQAQIEAAAQALLPLVEKTKQLQLKLGLYNHGGWGGEPENLVAVCQYLRAQYQAPQVGIVYNFHHGHEHVADFAESLAKMIPYLHCLNLNGMADPATVAQGRDKILPIGAGVHEKNMLQIVQASGYHGPIGILDHRMEMDAEKSLQANLAGLRAIVTTLKAPAP